MFIALSLPKDLGLILNLTYHHIDSLSNLLAILCVLLFVPLFNLLHTSTHFCYLFSKVNLADLFVPPLESTAQNDRG